MTDAALPLWAEITIAAINDIPIETPIIAIALVRTSSRVESAVNAVTADEIAAKPCNTRPTNTP